MLNIDPEAAKIPGLGAFAQAATCLAVYLIVACVLALYKGLKARRTLPNLVVNQS